MKDLMNLFAKAIEKDNLGKDVEFVPTYDTGLDLLNYRNGRIEDNKTLLGIDAGKIITIMGKPGTGKSTLAIQIAKNIVDQSDNENSGIIHFDFERATNKARLEVLTGWSKDKLKEKYKVLNDGISSESFYKTVKALAKIKTEHEDELAVDSGKIDSNGNPIMILPPTVVINDSWKTMQPQNMIDSKDVSGSMSGGAVAKLNNQIINILNGILFSANIILIIVNHITAKIEIGPVHTKADLNYLKPNESFPGGTSAMFLSNVLIKLQASTNLEPDKDLGIKGFISQAQLIKSRSNAAGYKFELVYDQEFGFDNILTNFWTLKKAGYLKGNGRAYYFSANPDCKFTQKTFKERYLEDKKLQKATNDTLFPLLEDMLSNKNSEMNEVDEEDDGAELELVKKIKGDIWLATDNNKYHYNEEDGTITPV